MVINVHPPALLKLKFLDEKLTITKISGLNKLCRFVYACTYYEQIRTYVATYKRELLTCHVALHQLIRPTDSHVNLTPVT